MVQQFCSWEKKGLLDSLSKVLSEFTVLPEGKYAYEKKTLFSEKVIDHFDKDMQFFL